MPSVASLALALGTTLAAHAGPARAPVTPPDTGALDGLSLVEVRPARRGPPRAVAVLLTGDGNWADLVRTVAGTLADSGVAVVGLRMRAYLSDGHRTPDGTAADVARVARTYLARWGASRLALVGYSRGADALPFVAARLPADLRPRVAAVAMLGLAHRAAFQFHWTDLVEDRARASDLAVSPELPRMRAALPGARLVCVYGSGESDSACRDADRSLVTRIERPGDHHFDGDYALLGRVVVDAIAGR